MNQAVLGVVIGSERRHMGQRHAGSGWLLAEPLTMQGGDVLLCEYGADSGWQMTNDEARKLARRLIEAADIAENCPAGAPTDASKGVAMQKARL